MSFSQVLMARDLISEDQAFEAERHQKTHGGSFLRSLVSLGFVSREDLDQVLGEIPPMPHSVEETGLDQQLLLNLILKSMYVTGIETDVDIADIREALPLRRRSRHPGCETEAPLRDPGHRRRTPATSVTRSRIWAASGRETL